jgi:hypothetical protein
MRISVNHNGQEPVKPKNFKEGAFYILRNVSKPYHVLQSYLDQVFVRIYCEKIDCVRFAPLENPCSSSWTEEGSYFDFLSFDEVKKGSEILIKV